MLTASALHCNWLNQKYVKVKFIYSEKATNVWEISTVDLSLFIETFKSIVEISQNFVAFSEYMNFKRENVSICDDITAVIYG